MKKLSLLILLAISLGYKTPSFSYEVDQFTNRDQVPVDSTAAINTMIKQRIEKAVSDANSGLLGTSLGSLDCNASDSKKAAEARFNLFDTLRKYLVTNNPIGLVERAVNNDQKIDKRKVSLENSIYADAKEKSEILKRFGVAPVITVNNVQIGTDKLGHFLNEGYYLYLNNFNQPTYNRRMRTVSIFNRDSENNFYGLRMTGVKSYADLAANFEGHQFWDRLCGKIYTDSTEEEKDYFKKNKCTQNAYLKCSVDPKTKKGMWVFDSDKFNISDYVNPAWDESINCNSYREDISEGVFSQLSRRVYTFKGNPKQPCPAELDKCHIITNKYNSYGTHHFVSPICRNVSKKISKKEPIDKNTKFDYTYTNAGSRLEQNSTSKPTSNTSKKSKTSN